MRKSLIAVAGVLAVMLTACGSDESSSGGGGGGGGGGGIGAG